jgi:hypothetical protein
MIWRVLVACLLASRLACAQGLPTVYHESSPPNAEFDVEASVHVLPGGTVAELSGSFSKVVPLALETVLTRTPSVRTVRFESPGGDVASALVVARILRDRGLDSYVGRGCNSACTLAFLGGQRRFLADGARLGFHRASAPGVAPSRLDAMLRDAYGQQGVPSGFIDHVLRTPPDSAWFPAREELREAGFVSGPVPAGLGAPDDPVSAVWAESLAVLRWASDATLVRFGQMLAPLLGALANRGGDVCWGFMHGAPTDLSAMARKSALEEMAAVLKQVGDDVRGAPAVGIDNAERTRLRAELGADALKRDANYCRALRGTVDAALGLPDGARGPALRALLAGG